MTKRLTLPKYHSFQAAYHRAFARELQAMVAQLPICQGDKVLDVGCGDGTYTAWLASHVGPDGTVTGVDNNAGYLALARHRIALAPEASRIKVTRGTIDRLPFRSNAFDLVWCAQSLFSLPEPESAIREMARVAKPGGIVALMEDDSLHQLLLPWPVDFEIALRHAEQQAFAEETAHASKFYVGRRLRSLLLRADLRPQPKKTYAFERAYPLNEAEERYVNGYFQSLRERTRVHLDLRYADTFERLLSPESPNYLTKQHDFSMTCLDQVVWGKKGH